jgi:CheY-like chemotaxis protein
VRVVVVHYEVAEAAALAGRLRQQGFEAEGCRGLGTKCLRDLRADPPDAVVIDLMRMPSYGRAIGAMLRETKSTRAIPLVFLEGDPEKTARARELLPDAGFATLARLGPVLRRTAERPPASPLPPQTSTGTASKLRIRVGATVALSGAPENVETLLGPLPEGVRLRRNSRDGDVVLLFVKSIASLGKALPAFKDLERGALWVLWPKRSSRAAVDITLPRIQDLCAPLGLVGYKACAIDDTWSAVAVSRRSRRSAL